MNPTPVSQKRLRAVEIFRVVEIFRGVRLSFFVILSLLMPPSSVVSASPVGATQGGKEAARAAEGSEPPAKKAPRVSDSILGIRVGTKIDEVHSKLKDLGTFGGRETRDGGRKEAWTLKKTEFSSVAYKTDAAGKVTWVTGFVREGKEIPFTKLGDLNHAARKSEQEAIWNVERPEGNYRLMAKGSGGRARVVQLLSLVLPPMN